MSQTEAIAIIASGNINIPNSASVDIDTQGTGKNVTLIAGAAVTVTAGTPLSSPVLGLTPIGLTDKVTVNMTGGNGGSIDLGHQQYK